MVTAELAIVDSTTIEKKGAAPGKAIITKSVGLGGGVTTEEMYQAPGLVSRPSKGARHIKIPVGQGRRYMVSIACKNYNVNVEVGEGETAIFSTTSDGKTVKAKIQLGSDGKIYAGNTEANFATLYFELLGILKDFDTAGNSVTQVTGPNSKNAIAAHMVKAKKLLKESV